jgi:glycosyltransferase involved in cell wall biosynthesis
VHYGTRVRIAHVLLLSALSVGAQSLRREVEDLCAALGRLGASASIVSAERLRHLTVTPRGSGTPAGLDLVVTDALSEFDLVHVHATRPLWGISTGGKVPTLTTLRCSLDTLDLRSSFHALARLPAVATTTSQPARAPMLDWRAIIPDGVSQDRIGFSPVAKDHLAFAGPISRLDRAIAIASEAGLPLKVASDGRDARLFRFIERHRATNRSVDIEIALSHDHWLPLVAQAQALLVCGPGSESLAPLVIESLAAGTPVLGFVDAEVASLIRPGRSGFVVESLSDALDVLDDVAVLDRRQCRIDFLSRFTSDTVAASYLSVYRGLTEHHAQIQVG